jgi:RNA polymerase sigma factor (sigma-70 family)
MENSRLKTPESALLSTPDDELVRQAQQHSRAAVDCLFKRHSGWIQRLVAGRLYKMGFSDAEIEDAQQDALLAIYRAIEIFYAHDSGQRRFKCFRSLLHLLVRGRLSNFTREYLRHQRNSQTASHFDLDKHVGTEFAWIVCGGLLPEDTDPVLRAQENERRERYDRAVHRLPAHLHMVWEELRAGRTLRELAARTGVHYEKLKRWRRQLVALLRARVNEC